MPTPRVTIDELPIQGAPEDTNEIIVQDSGVTKRMSIATLRTIESTPLTAHLADATDAHDASAISATPNAPPMDGTDVQAQLGQAATAVNNTVTGLADHLADTDGAHAATAITATPHDGVTSTHVQGQLEELAVALSVKDVVWVGPDAPTDPVVEMWWDTDEESAYLPNPPVQLATNAETNTGTATDKAITPAGLRATVTGKLIRSYTAANGWLVHATLDEAVTTAKTGGIIELPPGAFVVSTLDLTGATNLTIRGTHRALTTLLCTAASGNIIILDNTTQVTFEDLIITASNLTLNRTNGALFRGTNAARTVWRRVTIGALWRGMWLTDSSDCTWEDVRWLDHGTTNTWEFCILIDGTLSSSMWMRDCFFTSAIVTPNIPVWCRLIDVDTALINGCGVQKFSNATLAGVEIVRGQWHHLTDCYLEVGKLAGPCIKVVGASAGTQITSCHMVTSKYGIELAAEANGNSPRAVRVTGGRLAYNGQHGAFVSAGHLDLDGVDITNNSDNADGLYNGVHVTGAGEAIIRGCRIGTFSIPVGSGGSPHRWGIFGDVTATDNAITDATVAAQTAKLFIHLDPVVGRATTPDPATLPAQFMVLMKIRGSTAGADNNQTIVGQYDADPQRSWMITRNKTTGDLNFVVTDTGTSAGSTTNILTAPGAVSGADEWFCIAVDNSGASSVYTVWTKTSEGQDWVAMSPVQTVTKKVPFDSTGSLRVGAFTSNLGLFNGRVYYVEARSGTNPNAAVIGTRLWRFDAYEWMSGTTWTDLDGKVWTLSAAGAVVHAAS